MRWSLLIFLSFTLAACGSSTELSTEIEDTTESGSVETEQEASETSGGISNDEHTDDVSETEEPDDISDVDEAEDNTDDSAGTTEDNTNTSTDLNGPILVLGDSVMAWNVEEGTSIGHVIQEQTGQAVTIRAVSGAHFYSDEDEDIRSQYVEGDWSWVVFTGGGNDLNDRCECGDCNGVLNELLSSNGADGAVAEAADAIRETGAKVMFLTYYDLPSTAQFGFANCGDESEALAERAAAMAQARQGVYWVDMGQVVTPNDLSAFDEDHVHPSERGSALIGELVADVILAQ
ncbi:MAG: SGNH/GDSL hydrolase family protein [Deltaproteobacteria bacterium]|jgi:acyl-CoA thioesterase I|nr:SGNH/GDSL hydrolase family protein [Deltaproteobacteria bacterium]MBT6435739.1 SGNH/GDSL hydrolase family protein [Deltaproteobacteria bacterium]MBT6489669.1 SGNH/GDSL hydrolase family protein [Deltaproteobacteria bacterium]